MPPKKSDKLSFFLEKTFFILSKLSKKNSHVFKIPDGSNQTPAQPGEKACDSFVGHAVVSLEDDGSEAAQHPVPEAFEASHQMLLALVVASGVTSPQRLPEHQPSFVVSFQRCCFAAIKST